MRSPRLAVRESEPIGAVATAMISRTANPVRDVTDEIQEPELLAGAARAGNSVSTHQLRRLRDAGAMPRPRVAHADGARGSSSWYPAWAVERGARSPAREDSEHTPPFGLRDLFIEPAVVVVGRHADVDDFAAPRARFEIFSPDFATGFAAFVGRLTVLVDNGNFSRTAF